MRSRLSTFLASVSALLVAFAACGTTRGAPATAILRLAPSTGTFATTTGWEVTLDEAFLVLGGVYVYAPEGDPTAGLDPRVLGAFGPGVALAHGGHDPFGSRRVRIEWLGPERLDLLGTEPVEVGPMDGSVGRTTDATLAFEPLAGELLEPGALNHGHHAWISGTATRTAMGTSEMIAFEGGLDFAAGGTENLVESVATEADVGATGIWTLEVDVSRWLDEAHFERLDGTDPRPVDSRTQVGIAWDLGLRDPRAFSLTYVAAVAE